MKEKKKNHLRILIIFSVIFAIAVSAFYIDKAAFPFLLVRAIVSTGIKESRQLRKRLLCETDYVTLRDACRNISRQAKKGEIATGKYDIRGNPAPEVSRFPKPILELAPSYIYIDENDSGRIFIEMLGGLLHFGVTAYSEDYNEPFIGFVYGDRKLIDGLWYNDDGYRGNPEYDKVIDEFINKYKKK